MQLSKQQIKYLRMFQQKKYREERKRYLVEGIKMVNEAIDNVAGDIEMICFSEKAADKVFTDKLPSGVKLISASGEDIARISGQKSPQEAIALIKITGTTDDDNSALNDLAFALDSVRDPGNLGTILRLADWFGIRQLWCSPDCVDCYNPKAVQSSMGAIFRVRVDYVDLQKTLSELKNSGIIIYGTSLKGKDIYSCALKKPAVILLGNEAAGINKNLNANISQELLIPNYSRDNKTSESLNVAIAAAVTVAEFRRQLNTNYSK